jgi:hypothetical protein
VHLDTSQIISSVGDTEGGDATVRVAVSTVYVVVLEEFVIKFFWLLHSLLVRTLQVL